MGIVLVFFLVSVSVYSANGAFANLSNEIESMESEICNLQNVLNNTYVELNQTRADLSQSIIEKHSLHDELNVSIDEKVALQNTLTETELSESIEENSVLLDKLILTSPPTAVTKTNRSRLWTLMDDRFNLLGVQTHLLDYNYSLTNKSEVERFLSRDLEINDQFEYITDVYDCDDFALRAYGELSIPGWSGLAIGIASFKTSNTTFHMTLLFVDVDEKIWMIDYSEVKEIPDGWILSYVLI